MSTLKQRLFDEYGGFADKRIKRLEKGKNFVIDDRSAEDIGADGRLLSYFCMLFAEAADSLTSSDADLSVTLCGNVPDSAGVQQWVSDNGASFVNATPQHILRFSIRMGEQEKLRSLAKKIRAIVALGAPRYSTPSYKYVCPRTAKSLERLANVLDEAWPSS